MHPTRGSLRVMYCTITILRWAMCCNVTLKRCLAFTRCRRGSRPRFASRRRSSASTTDGWCRQRRRLGRSSLA
eukprot:891577-Prymnesium_polylepis.2